jgi:hypothetical protein
MKLLVSTEFDPEYYILVNPVVIDILDLSKLFIFGLDEISFGGRKILIYSIFYNNQKYFVEPMTYFILLYNPFINKM